MSRLLADQGAGGSRGSVGPRVMGPGDQGVILMGGEVDIISIISICLSIISKISIMTIYLGLGPEHL